MSSPAPEREPPPPADDDERAFRASLEQLVDVVRVEPSRLFARAFMPAFLCVMLGGLLVASSFKLSASGPAHNLSMLLGGIVVVACGPGWALFVLIRAMNRDLYVALRVDGLAVRLDLRANERVYAWDDIAEVVLERTGGVRVELTSGEQVLLRGPFSATSDEQLAARIRDARRLGVWHRLAPRTR